MSGQSDRDQLAEKLIAARALPTLEEREDARFLAHSEYVATITGGDQLRSTLQALATKAEFASIAAQLVDIKGHLIEIETSLDARMKALEDTR